MNVRGGLRIFSVNFWHSEGWTPRNEALLEAVLKRTRTTKHPWLIACDANMSTEGFEKKKSLLPFSCAAAQTCSTCTASQFQRSLWPAWIGRSRGVGTGHGLGHQELPTGPASPVEPFTRLSRSPRCLSRVAAIRRRLWTLCTLCSGLRGPSCHGVCVQLR